MIPKENLEAEQREYEKVCKMNEKKDAKGLDRWIKKFNEEGEFWLGENSKKSDKKDWL